MILIRARRLVEIRTERKMPQREVAAAAGVSQTVISQMERGKRPCEGTMIERMAQALHCTVADLQAAPGAPISAANFKGGGGAGNDAPMMRAMPADED